MFTNDDAVTFTLTAPIGLDMLAGDLILGNRGYWRLATDGDSSAVAGTRIRLMTGCVRSWSLRLTVALGGQGAGQVLTCLAYRHPDVISYWRTGS